MKFFDQAKIFVKAGTGGSGSASFRREKYVEFGGPDGGDGGKGGDVYAIGVKDVNTLAEYRYRQHFMAENGENGLGKQKTGKSGEDLYINIPIGTEIYDAQTQSLICDIIYAGQIHKIASGGKGGLGNIRFKTSTNRSPRHYTKGSAGEELTLILQLKLIANVGVIGLPNAGKSTFLSITSEARPKIADYAFTTLIPNLGVVKIHDTNLVFADIPGLIENAHLGKGLGIEFLRHIQRCSILIHMIDCNHNIEESYITVKKELIKYNPSILDKLEIIIINKIDSLTDEAMKFKEKEIHKFKQNYKNILNIIISNTIDIDHENETKECYYNNDNAIQNEFNIWNEADESIDLTTNCIYYDDQTTIDLIHSTSYNNSSENNINNSSLSSRLNYDNTANVHQSSDVLHDNDQNLLLNSQYLDNESKDNNESKDELKKSNNTLSTNTISQYDHLLENTKANDLYSTPEIFLCSAKTNVGISNVLDYIYKNMNKFNV